VAQVSPVLGTPVVQGFTEEERALLYSQIVSHMLSGEQARYIYISPYVGKGERLDEPDQDTPVPNELVARLRESDPNRLYELRPFEDVVDPLEDGGRVRHDGVFITLGEIQAEQSGEHGPETEAIIRSSIYRRVGSAEGYIYRFDRNPSGPGGWKLVDVTLEWKDDS
jgi:hypothetical protein